MANATSGTVTALTKDGTTADPTADTLDTGTSDVTLYYDVTGESDRVIFRCVNTAAAAATFSLVAGSYPPAATEFVGDVVSGSIAQNGIVWIGPVSSSRCMQSGANAGKLGLKTHPSSGTIGATIQCFKLPLA